MALKALMLRQKIDRANKALEDLRAKDAEFETREADLEASIREAETDEDQAAVTEAVDAFEAEKTAHETARADLEREIGELEELLAAEEARQDTTPAKAPEKREAQNMVTSEVRGRFGLTDELTKREHIQAFLQEVRTCIREKRELTNVGLTIPKEYLGIIKEQVPGYSKLYKYVTVRRTRGEGRMTVMGTIPEAIWTEACGRLNELTLGFHEVTTEGNKVSGFFALCNAVLDDSDVDLSAEIIAALSQSIGLALDKAILYGTGHKMPEGIVTRLAQTAQPEDYPATARPWVDMHTTHILKIGSSVTGLALFQTLLLNTGVAKGKYSNGHKVWCMNDTTYNYIKAQGMSINANGAIVSGIDGTMPVIGGDVVTLDFIPDYNVIGGYMDEYLLAERAGIKIDQSKECRFMDDQTVFKGTARYDGVPVIAEGFVVIGVNNTDATTALEFAPDKANEVAGIVLKKVVDTVKATKKIQIEAYTTPIDVPIAFASSDTTKATVNETTGEVTGVAAGSAVITLTAGGANAVVNLTVTN